MSAPLIDETDIQSVVDVLRSGQLSMGPQVERFERGFAEFVGASHGVAVSSGTAGLFLALLASGVQPGEAVITTPFSFIASANAIVHAGATPLFVDVEETTGNIGASAVNNFFDWHKRGEGETPVTPRSSHYEIGSPPHIRAILPVHVFGLPAPVLDLADIAAEFEATLVEDGCEAIGTTIDGQMIGTSGAAAVFAFYPNKQMTTGEGGMIITNDHVLAARCRSLRNQGRDTFDEWLNHSRLGYNFRMDEMSAALGLSQLKRLEELLNRRSLVAQWYSERLQGVEGVTSPSSTEHPGRSWFVYVIRLSDFIDRDDVIRQLAQAGIPARPYFPPIHLQPYYRSTYGYRPGDFPQAEALGKSCLALPFSAAMDEAQVELVTKQLLNLVTRA